MSAGRQCRTCGGPDGRHGLVHSRNGVGGGSNKICPDWHPDVLTVRVRVPWFRICDGCKVVIMALAEHLEHEHRGLGSSLFECMTCALKNGRPEVAEPDVPEVPLVWDGIA